jgi:hypothetical protein
MCTPPPSKRRYSTDDELEYQEFKQKLDLTLAEKPVLPSLVKSKSEISLVIPTNRRRSASSNAITSSSLKITRVMSRPSRLNLVET